MYIAEMEHPVAFYITTGSHKLMYPKYIDYDQFQQKLYQQHYYKYVLKWHPNGEVHKW